MKAKIVLSAVLLAVVFAVVHPVLAGPAHHATGKPTVIEQPAGLSLVRGDLHVHLKAF